MLLLIVFVSLCVSSCSIVWQETTNTTDAVPDPSVGLTPRCTGQSKCGYVNQTGMFVIAPVHKVVRPFFEGLASVYSDPTGWGVIYPKGNCVVPPSFAAIGPFSEGLTASCPSLKNLYWWVYIDRAGKTAIELKFSAEQPFPFHDGRA
jgi:WG containing repeat